MSLNHCHRNAIEYQCMLYSVCPCILLIVALRDDAFDSIIQYNRPISSDNIIIQYHHKISSYHHTVQYHHSLCNIIQSLIDVFDMSQVMIRMKTV